MENVRVLLPDYGTVARPTGELRIVRKTIHGKRFWEADTFESWIEQKCIIEGDRTRGIEWRKLPVVDVEN